MHWKFVVQLQSSKSSAGETISQGKPSRLRTKKLSYLLSPVNMTEAQILEEQKECAYFSDYC